MIARKLSPAKPGRWPSLCWVLLTILPLSGSAQDKTGNCPPPQSDTSFVDERGTDHVARVIPVPDTVSPEAQKLLAQPRADTEPAYDAAKDRAQASAWQADGGTRTG